PPPRADAAVGHAVGYRRSAVVSFFRLVLVLVPLGTGSATVFWAQRAAVSAFTRCRGCVPPAEVRPGRRNAPRAGRDTRHRPKISPLLPEALPISAPSR